MAELPESILAEQENVETALSNLRAVLQTGRKSVIELAAKTGGSVRAPLVYATF